MEKQDLKQIANCSNNNFCLGYVSFLYWLMDLYKSPVARIKRAGKSLIEALLYFQVTKEVFQCFPGDVSSTLKLSSSMMESSDKVLFLN